MLATKDASKGRDINKRKEASNSRDARNSREVSTSWDTSNICDANKRGGHQHDSKGDGKNRDANNSLDGRSTKRDANFPTAVGTQKVENEFLMLVGL
jgi:hypothetical protein